MCLCACLRPAGHNIFYLILYTAFLYLFYFTYMNYLSLFVLMSCAPAQRALCVMFSHRTTFAFFAAAGGVVFDQAADWFWVGNYFQAVCGAINNVFHGFNFERTAKKWMKKDTILKKSYGIVTIYIYISFSPLFLSSLYTRTFSLCVLL